MNGKMGFSSKLGSLTAPVCVNDPRGARHLGAFRAYKLHMRVGPLRLDMARQSG
jgi:hypothetical protein